MERTTDGSPCEMTAGGSIRMNDFAMKRQASLKRRKESAARELSMSSAAAVGSKESPTITGSGGGGSANAAGSATVTAASAANLGRYLRGPHNKRGSGRSKSEHGRELSGRELDEQAFEMFQLSQTNLAVVHERGFSGASVYSIDQASPGGGVVVVKKHGKDGSGSGSGSNNHSKEVSKDSSKQRLEGEELVPPVPPIPSKIGAGGATHRRDRGSEEEGV